MNKTLSHSGNVNENAEPLRNVQAIVQAIEGYCTGYCTSNYTSALKQGGEAPYPNSQHFHLTTFSVLQYGHRVCWQLGQVSVFMLIGVCPHGTFPAISFAHPPR